MSHFRRVFAKWEATEAQKYNPNWDDQPRVPAGNSDGGQWTDGGGGAGASAANAGAGTMNPGVSGGAGEAARRAAQAAAKLRRLLQSSGQVATAAGAGTSALAVGILMATANATGGARRQHQETLEDGTVVTVRSTDDTVFTEIRAEAPDGTITSATLNIRRDGSFKVLSAGVQPRGRQPQAIDPNSFAAAAGALINAATGGRGGGKRGPVTPPQPDTMGTPQGPEDFEPENSPLGSHGSNNPGRGYGNRPDTPSYRDVHIRYEHIYSGHRPTGARAVQSTKKSVFPQHMNTKAIEKSIREAYRNASQIRRLQRSPDGEIRVLLEGHSGGLKIQMRYNITRKLIETAYPIF